jgi:hypothetical protein
MVIDDSLSSKLDRCANRTELCDADGRVLGVYIPDVVRQRRLYEIAKSRMTPELIAELERRTAEPGCYSTAEVMERLRELESTHAR